jgi:hypothetical protein
MTLPKLLLLSFSVVSVVSVLFIPRSAGSALWLRLFLMLALLAPGSVVNPVSAATLHLAAGTVDITPDQPVALTGQRRVRISKKPASRIYASVLALESRDGDKSIDHAVTISCDLVAIRGGVREQLREKLAKRTELKDLDIAKVFLNATHTHTAPVMLSGRYVLPETGIMQPAEFVDWLTTRLADAVAKAWTNRAPGKVAWGQSHAVIAQNRRPFYANGTAKMYGNTNSSTFRGIEGYEDHSIDVLYFWDAADKLTATIINVPCPSQEIGGTSSISADFWDPVRQQLWKKHGKDLNIIPWTGAGGDTTSKQAFGKPADERMRKLRGNISRLDEVAGRIVHAWEEAYSGAVNDIRSDVPFAHHTRIIDLPYRKVEMFDRAAAMTDAKKYKDDPKQQWNYLWNQSVVDRANAQRDGTQEPYKMELHVLRLGDVAICTNEFELYTDFGIQMKARSPAIQTFVIQLAGPGTYLPSQRAVSLGGYGAVIQSSQIGPKGGQVLVEETVKTFNDLFLSTPSESNRNN